MSSLQERLALMAGITLTESAKNAYKIKTIKITLDHLGITDDHSMSHIQEFAWKAVEVQDVLTIEDIKIENGMLIFTPMLTDGEVSVNDASQFRQVVSDFMSDPENFDNGIHEAATGSNIVFSEYSKWKAAADKAGLEIFAKGAVNKYEARKYEGTKSEVFGKFDKSTSDGWLHSSVVKENTNYDDMGNAIPEGPLPQGLAEIAAKLGFQTLETRNSDGLDFKEVSVQSVKEALLAAYELGKQQGTTQSTPAANQPMASTLPAAQPPTNRPQMR